MTTSKDAMSTSNSDTTLSSSRILCAKKKKSKRKRRNQIGKTLTIPPTNSLICSEKLTGKCFNVNTKNSTERADGADVRTD